MSFVGTDGVVGGLVPHPSSLIPLALTLLPSRPLAPYALKKAAKREFAAFAITDRLPGESAGIGKY
jgi:hypothetical protein